MLLVSLLGCVATEPPPGVEPTQWVGAEEPSDSSTTETTTTAPPPQGYGEATFQWPSSRGYDARLAQHAADGGLVDTWELQPGDTATMTVEPETSLTVVIGGTLHTLHDIRPGQAIVYEDPPWGPVGSRRLALDLDPVPGANGYTFITFCSDGSGDGVRTHDNDAPEDVRVSDPCAKDGGHVDLLGWAFSGETPVAMVAVEGIVVGGGELAPSAGWDADLGVTTITSPVDDTSSPTLYVEVFGTRDGRTAFAWDRWNWGEKGETSMRIPLPLGPAGFLDGAVVCVGQNGPGRACVSMDPPTAEVVLDRADFGPRGTVTASETGATLDLEPEETGTVTLRLVYRNSFDLDSPYSWYISAPAADREFLRPQLPTDWSPHWFDHDLLRIETVFLSSDVIPHHSARLAALPTEWLSRPDVYPFLPPMRADGHAIEVRWTDDGP